MKKCTKCNLFCGIDFFHRKKEGYSSVCKKCRSNQEKARYQKGKETIIAKAREYRKKNKETISKRRKERWENDPIYRKKKVLAYRKWAIKNKEKLNAYWREGGKKYRLTPKGKEIEHKRHLRYRGFSVKHTEEQWQQVLQENKNKCIWCGTMENITKDHIIPLSKGGCDCIINIQPLCGKCNRMKWDIELIFDCFAEPGFHCRVVHNYKASYLPL